MNWKFKPTESFMVTDIVSLWSILALYHLCELQKGTFFTKTNFNKKQPCYFDPGRGGPQEDECGTAGPNSGDGKGTS